MKPGCPERSAQQPFWERGQLRRARRDDRERSAKLVVARRSGQEKLVDDDSSLQCKRNVSQDIERSVMRRPAERAAEPTVQEVALYTFRSRGVPEMSNRILTDELRELASEEEHSPEPSAASTGQGAVRCRSVQAELAHRTRAVKEHFTAPSQLASRIPEVAKLGAGAGRLDHGHDQQFADESSVGDPCHRAS